MMAIISSLWTAEGCPVVIFGPRRISAVASLSGLDLSLEYVDG